MDQNAPRNVVVLVCDRLSPACLGPYGNTTIETGAMNQLAAESFLVEQCLTDALDLPSIYDKYWAAATTGEHSLIGKLVDRKIRTTLLTDEPVVIEHPFAGDFDRHIQVPSAEHSKPAATIEETDWAAMLSAAVHEMSVLEDEPGSAQFLWIHVRGCQADWAAPYALREALAHEDDPDPPSFVEAPHRELVGEVDPDELLGMQQAYLAEVSVFDTCLEPLVEQLSSAALANTLFVLTAPRGYPLGEHGVIGDAVSLLQIESLQVPLLVRFPGGQFAAERSHAIWQPKDINALLQRWMAGDDLPPGEFSLDEVSLDDLGGERAGAVAGDRWSFRTPAWFATGQGDDDESIRLYVKPDDRFEENDVADICREVAEAMREEYQKFQQAVANGTLGDLPPLTDELRVPPE